MHIEKKIGDRLRKLRDKKGLTQEELSRRTGLNRTFIIHIEKGRRNISIKSLERMLNGLETSFSLFFKKIN